MQAVGWWGKIGSYKLAFPGKRIYDGAVGSCYRAPFVLVYELLRGTDSRIEKCHVLRISGMLLKSTSYQLIHDYPAIPRYRYRRIFDTTDELT